MYQVEKIARVCPFCGDTREVEVPTEGFRLWRAGELIQNALPELSPDDREALMTGICPRCWEETFSTDY